MAYSLKNERRKKDWQSASDPVRALGIVWGDLSGGSGFLAAPSAAPLSERRPEQARSHSGTEYTGQMWERACSRWGQLSHHCP
ncbi:hypothetical protein EMIT0P43_80078 [Pseudomonas jessenii]